MARVLIEVDVDAKDGVRNVRQLDRQLDNVGRSGAKSVGGLSSAFSLVPPQIALATAALTVLSAGFSALKSAVADTAKVRDEITKLGRRLGISTEDLSAFRLVAERSGVTIEDVGTGLRRLAANAFDVSQGTGEAKVAFAALGISVTDANGNLRTAKDLLLDVADRFVNLEDGTLKTALAQDIFGRSGANLITVLNEGRDGIEALERRAKELGITFDDEAGKASENFQDALTDLNFAVEGLKASIGEDLIPLFTDLVNLSTQFLVVLRSTKDPAVALATLIAIITGAGPPKIPAGFDPETGDFDIKEFRRGKGAAGIVGAPFPELTPEIQKRLIRERLEQLKKEAEEKKKADAAAKRAAAEAKKLADELERAVMAGREAATFAVQGAFPPTTEFIDFDRELRELLDGGPLPSAAGEAAQVPGFVPGEGPIPGMGAVPGIEQLADPRALTAFESFSDQLGNLLGDLGDKFGLYQVAVEGAGDAFAQFVLGQKSLGAALRDAVKQSLASLAREAAIRAITHTAQGFAALTPWGAPVYGPAAVQFKSAALWAAAAAAAGAGAKAIGGGGNGGGAGSQVGFDNQQRNDPQQFDLSGFGVGAASQSNQVLGQLSAAVGRLNSMPAGEVVVMGTNQAGGVATLAGARGLSQITQESFSEPIATGG